MSTTDPNVEHQLSLSDLLKRKSSDRPWRVLDIGPAYNVNLMWFAARGASYRPAASMSGKRWPGASTLGTSCRPM